MFSKLVAPAPLGRLRSLLLRIEADLWGPDWLLRWLDQDDANRTLCIRVIRDIIRRPDDWTANGYGLVNSENGLAVWTSEGPQSIAIADKGTALFRPSAYWRYMLYRVIREHSRLLADKQLAVAVAKIGNAL